jgi:hypothetical protein
MMIGSKAQPDTDEYMNLPLSTETRLNILVRQPTDYQVRVLMLARSVVFHTPGSIRVEIANHCTCTITANHIAFFAKLHGVVTHL